MERNSLLLVCAWLAASLACTGSPGDDPVDGGASSGGLTGSSSTGGGGASSAVSQNLPASSSSSPGSSAVSSAPSQGGMSSSAGSSGASSTASAATSSAASGGGGTVQDPEQPGPFTVDVQQVSRFQVAATNTRVDLYVAGPRDAPAPVPVVLMAPGFQLPASQYQGYARHLASHGMVVVLTTYNASLFLPDHARNAQEIRGALDWLAGDATWSARADLQRLGTTGHSLGGKLAVLVAAQDARVKASMTLDPVNGGQAPDVPMLLPLQMPLGFLGETTDAMAAGLGMACAPASSNYQVFYARADAPALEVTVLGANHMSFLDDVASCDFTCSLCNDATAPNAEVTALSRAMLAAFFRRHLLGDPSYDAYLDGDVARARYVDTGRATIRSR